MQNHSKVTPIRSLSILTNHWGQNTSIAWREASTLIAPTGTSLISSLKLAFQLYRKRMDYHCVVLGAGRSDILFALIQTVLPFRKVPCVMIDCLLSKSPNTVRQFVTKLILQTADRTVDRYVVWARREIDAFSEAFDLAREKFTFVPYHTTLDTFQIEPSAGDYIFSGGNVGRDYATLIEAVRGLPVKLLIASTRPENFRNISIPTNVEVKGFSHAAYLVKMAECRISVVSLVGGSLRSPGQQTFLNSMWFGKPTIVTDTEGAADYMHHEKDGLLVPPHDPIALRNAILMLWDNPEKAREMGENAKNSSRRFTTDEHFKKIIAVVEDVLKMRRSVA